MAILRFLSGRWKSAAAGALLAAGVPFLPIPLADALVRASFDLPFPTRPHPVLTNNVVVIYIDKDSAETLGQPWTDAAWERDVHARLVRRLVQSRARAIVFDVLFDRAGHQDHKLIEAAQEARRENIPVVVGITLKTEHRESTNVLVTVTTPVDPFAELKAVVDWGIAEEVADHTGRVDQPRRHSAGSEDRASVPLRVAQLVEPDVVAQLPAERWINFYGPPETLLSRSYAEALEKDRMPDSFFSNKVCFIGARAQVGVQGGKNVDEWHTPYSRYGAGMTTGVELNATIYLNLIRRDWLTRLSLSGEIALVLGVGILLGAGLTFLRPAFATLAGIAASLAVAALAARWMWHGQVWFAWLIPAAVQMPVALVWSIHAHTRRVARENQTLQEELSRRTENDPTVRIPGLAAPTANPSPAASPAAAALAATGPPSIPDHSLLRRIGKGAYGEVWLARNVIGTCHAVKIIQRGDFEGDAPFEREFHGIQKFMPISRLHPGLVQILHAGRNDTAGFFYYVMEPADDENRGAAIEPDSYSSRSMASELRRRSRLPASECLYHALRLTEALEFLHAQHLIHRDIKPSNIIFVRSEAKLADIGLVTEIATSTTDVSYVGTRGYIPPEGPGRPSADLFALGRVLYQACMGLPLDRFPELPETIVSRPDYDLLVQLNQIILRACDDDLSRRYATATDMAADLRALYAKHVASLPQRHG